MTCADEHCVLLVSIAHTAVATDFYLGISVLVVFRGIRKNSDTKLFATYPLGVLLTESNSVGGVHFRVLIDHNIRVYMPHLEVI